MARRSRFVGLFGFASIGFVSWLAMAPPSVQTGATRAISSSPKRAIDEPPPVRKSVRAESGHACAVLPAGTSDAIDVECRSALAEFLKQNGLCERGSARALVASVPDPVESRINDLTDQVLSAVLLAAEKDGRAFVDAWLPWVRDRHLVQEKESSGRAWPEATGCHEFWPGIMVVAKYDDKGRSASAMLVTGELPTSGIRSKVVERAAKMSAALNQEPQLRFVGPVFSGSAGPLRETLLALIDARAPRAIEGAHIWTGSATNPQVANLLRSDPRLTFEATVAPDAPSLQAVYRFLVKNHFTVPSGNLLRHVAILREAETSYGQGLGGGPHRRDANGSDDYQAGYEILFPLHISEVRSDWEKQSSALKGSQAQKVSLPLDAVRIDLQERVTDARDDLPTFSSIASNYDERALTSVLATLRDNHIDTVGIFATDTRDRLFLAEAVHTHAPDAQLFMLESDILLGHPDYAEALRGTIVASTYPLVTENQSWSGSHPRNERQERKQFASSIAEGVYNATSLALADLRAGNDPCASVSEYRWPRFRQTGRRIEAGKPQTDPPTEAEKPPLWLTIVGPDALWPLAALEIDDADYMAEVHCPVAAAPAAKPAQNAVPAVSGIYPPPPPPKPTPAIFQLADMELLHWVSVAFILFCVSAAGFAFLVVAALNGRSRVLHGGFLQPMLVLDPAWRGNPQCRRAAMCLVAFAEVVLLAVTVWLGTAAVTTWSIGSPEMDWWQRCRIFAVSLAMAATVFALARMSSGSGKGLRLGVPAIVVVVALGGPFVLKGFAGHFFSDGGDATGVFRYWRMMHPFNLVSPLPMVCGLIAIVLINSSYWVRLIDLDTRMRERPLCASGLVEEAVNEFWNSVRMLRRPPYLLCAVAVLAVFWIGWNVRAPLDFHDGRTLRALVPTLAALVVLECGFKMWHLCAMWSATKRFLCCVDVERLTPAFKELRQEIIAALGHGSGMHQPHEHVLWRLSRLFEETHDENVEAVRANLEAYNRKDEDRAATPRERFLAMRIAVLSAYGVCRLRGVWFRLAACSLLFVASMACYPVHPHKEILVLCWLLVGTVAGTTAWVFVEMNRNAVLSTLAGTNPNEVNWTPEFVEKLVTVVGLPLLGIVAAAFPQVARVIGSLLGPIFHGH